MRLFLFLIAIKVSVIWTIGLLTLGYRPVAWGIYDIASWLIWPEFMLARRTDGTNQLLDLAWAKTATDWALGSSLLLSAVLVLVGIAWTRGVLGQRQHSLKPVLGLLFVIVLVGVRWSPSYKGWLVDWMEPAMATKSPYTAEMLLKDIRSDEPTVRRRAVLDAIFQLPTTENVEEVMYAALTSSDPGVRKEAAEGWAQRKLPAKRLYQLLEEGTLDLRLTALQALGHTGPYNPDEKAAEVLLQATNDRDPLIRAGAARALGVHFAKGLMMDSQVSEDGLEGKHTLKYLPARSASPELLSKVSLRLSELSVDPDEPVRQSALAGIDHINR